MAKTRSRNYPALSLGEALERARELYKQEGRSRTPAAVAVGAWGYNSLNGASLRVVSALRQYGLIEGSNEEMRLSPRALTLLLEPEQNPDYADALHEALRTPAVFQEIIQEYGEDIPSDGALVSYLVRKLQFGEQGARTLIDAFRASVELVRTKTTSYSSPQSTSLAVERYEPIEAPKTMQNRDLPVPIEAKVKEFTWPLSGNTVVTVRVTLGNAEEHDAEEIALVLDLAKTRIRHEIMAVVKARAIPVAPMPIGSPTTEDTEYEVVAG